MASFRLFSLLFLLNTVLVASQSSKSPNTSQWLTLSGNAPLVIAKGGFSGLFPDSSFNAYSLALITSLPNVILWCDVRLTKDNVGICLPELKMDNCTDIATTFPNGEKVYLVNGISTKGWFPVDFTMDNISTVILTQAIYSRTNLFDDSGLSILTVEQVVSQIKPPGLWLNIQHDMFFRQHNLSMRSYVLSVSRRVIVNHISSPEVDFLSSIVARFKPSKTKLVFRFLEADSIEPSTNQSYGTLLRNLTFIKTFASGILVPKSYIWPTDLGLYLQPHTSVVIDAHREGLEVFASDFANDYDFSYNYSYDPMAEYISFIDNADFSVDGVLSDFPITPSVAIDCFSHITKGSSVPGKPIVISRNGASGVYPGSTDLAYRQAVEDGADYIDCSVQLTKDGVPVCLNSINLLDGTTVAQSPFSSRSSSIPEIQATRGIFTFNLTWQEIQSLMPAISNPYLEYRLERNPAYKNAGKFLSLSDFLTYAKGQNLSGILISIENAAYLAENLHFSVIDIVRAALNASGYDDQTSQEVMIQSSNSSVLAKFKQQTKYKLMYMIIEDISGAESSSIEEIKQFADSVAISKSSEYPEVKAFLTRDTGIVKGLKLFNLTVYTHLFRNEFVSQAWDYYSDPTVEINSYAQGAQVDGVITDFPGTASAYKRNKCLNLGNNTPMYMTPVRPGGLMQLIAPQVMPPAEAPNPLLTESDVSEPPFPSVTPARTGTGGATVQAPVSPSSPNGQPRSTVPISVALGMLLLGYLLI